MYIYIHICACDHVELGQVSTSSFEPRCTEGKHASIDHFSGLRIQTTPCPGAFIPTRLALFDVQLTRQHWQPCPGTRRRSRNTSVWPRHHTAPSFEHLARLCSKHCCLCIFSRTCGSQSNLYLQSRARERSALLRWFWGPSACAKALILSFAHISSWGKATRPAGQYEDGKLTCPWIFNMSKLGKYPKIMVWGQRLGEK